MKFQGKKVDPGFDWTTVILGVLLFLLLVGIFFLIKDFFGKREEIIVKDKRGKSKIIKPFVSQEETEIALAKLLKSAS